MAVTVVGEAEREDPGSFGASATTCASGDIVFISSSDDGNGGVSVTAPNGETVYELYNYEAEGGSDHASCFYYQANSTSTAATVSATSDDVLSTKMVVTRGGDLATIAHQVSAGDDIDVAPSIGSVASGDGVLCFGHLQDEDGPFGNLTGGADSGSFTQLDDAPHSDPRSCTGAAFANNVSGTVVPGAWNDPSSGNFVRTSTIRIPQASGSSSGDGSASGTGAASGAGTANASAAGASAGTGAASGAGTATASADGSSAGTGEASAAGQAVAAVDASASATGNASGDGVAVAVATGSASATGTASGVGDVGSTAAGSAQGEGAGDAEGVAVAVATGTASATGAATGVGEAEADGTGTAAGEGSAAGGGASQITGAGSASGSGEASGAGGAYATGAGLSAGLGVAVGEGECIALANGSAAGLCAANGDADISDLVRVATAGRPGGGRTATRPGQTRMTRPRAVSAGRR